MSLFSYEEHKFTRFYFHGRSFHKNPKAPQWKEGSMSGGLSGTRLYYWFIPVTHTPLSSINFISDLLNELICTHLGIVLTQDLFPNHKVEACKIDDLTSGSLETLV